MQRVFVWQREADDEPWPWRFPADARRLDDALAQTDARLAVLDPVLAFLDESVLCASDQTVRRALASLLQLAEKHRCTLLMLRHLNKQGGGKALYRGLGSIAFVAVSRFAMLVGRDPADAGRCVLAQVRHSLSGLQPSLAYQLRAADNDLPTVEWLGTSSISADELLGGTGQRAPRDEAAEFLQEFLADGPRTSRALWEAAEQLDLSVRTLNRAKRQLKIRSHRVTEDGRPVSYWLLRGQEVPASESPLDPELVQALREMAERFPGPNPLEENDGDA